MRKLTYEAVPNPWRLTPGECAVLSAIVKTGCDKRAAGALNISHKTVSAFVLRAKGRMRASTRLHVIIEWDRFTRASVA
jgi:FixJ family two-component response regulator